MNKNKLIMMGIAMLTLSFGVSVKASSTEVKNIYAINNVQAQKNLVENNGSFAVSDGEWIYYSGNGQIPIQPTYGVKSELYKIRLSDDKKEKLTGDYASKIWTYGDWVYYINYKGNYDDSSLYRVKKDGTLRSEVSRDIPTSLIIDGDYIYYSKFKYNNKEENLSLYKMKLDGNDKKMLSSEKGIGLNKVDDYIYYQNANDNYKIYRLKTDGSENKLVSSDSCADYMEIVENYIYYCNNDDNNNIYRVLLDGTKRERVSDKNSRNINVVDGYVYYTSIDSSDTATLCKSKIDGTEKEVLSDIDSSTQVAIKGGYVYFCGYNSKGIYQIKTDGSGLKKLNNKEAIISMNIVGDWIYYEELDKDTMKKNLCKMKINGHSDQLVK